MFQNDRTALAVGEKPLARKEDRRPVDLPGHVLLNDGSQIEIKVVDLSSNGCRISLAVALLPGTVAKLSVSRLGGFEACVRWYSNGMAGLCFSPSNSSEKSQTARNHDRHPISANVSLRRGGRPQYHARVFDLTPAGCKVEFIERPRPEETIWAKFEGLDSLEATVRWVDGYYGGIQFARPIHAGVFELLLARLSG